MDSWDQAMQRLERVPIPERLDPTEERIAEFERHIGVRLPLDYRTFLSRHGGFWVIALAPIQEPTPFGDNAIIESFYGFMDNRKSDDLTWRSDSAKGAPVAIPIAGGSCGQIFLFTSSHDASSTKPGTVFFCDEEGRYAWPDEIFFERFESLSAVIKEFLSLRRQGKLPKKPKSMMHYYRIADNFSSFLESCRYFDIDAAVDR